MARRVLGDDPFASKAPAPKAAAAKGKKTAKVDARTKKPAAKPAPAKPAPGKAAPAPEVVEEAAPAVAESAPAEVTATLPSEPAHAPAADLDAPETATETLSVEYAPPRDVASEVAALEASIDALLAEADDPTLRAKLASLGAKLGGVPASTTIEVKPVDEPEPEAIEKAPVEDVSREMLSSDFYLRQWGKVALRGRAEEVDPFGYDPDVAGRWEKTLDFLYDRWLKVEVEGIENVPSTGRVALVANHGGAIPVDGLVLATALRKEHPTQRQLRWLAEDFVFHTPYAGTLVNRLGAVRACQENAERLLAMECCVGLFPEGVKGISKKYRDRYKLQRFGRGGHIKLALRTRTPIVPVTIVGSDDSHPLLGQSPVAAKFLGLPYLPITPTFPWLGPVGLLPLPARWKIVFGEPISLAEFDPAQAEDEVLVGRLNERLRSTIQETLDREMVGRPGWFGLRG